MWIRPLTTAECTSVLTENRIAHLACCQGGQPYIVPINYAYSEHHLYAFSMHGRKIEYMRANPLVALHVQSQANPREWRSVIVEGKYEELPDAVGSKRSRDHAWSLLSQHANWWEPGGFKLEIPVPQETHIFFRIIIETMSGRQAGEI